MNSERTEMPSERPGSSADRCVCGGPCHGLKEWSTTEELAGWLGLPVDSLYNLRRKKLGPRGHMIGPGLLFRRGDVEKWLLTRLEGS